MGLFCNVYLFCYTIPNAVPKIYWFLFFSYMPQTFNSTIDMEGVSWIDVSSSSPLSHSLMDVSLIVIAGISVPFKVWENVKLSTPVLKDANLLKICLNFAQGLAYICPQFYLNFAQTLSNTCIASGVNFPKKYLEWNILVSDHTHSASV